MFLKLARTRVARLVLVFATCIVIGIFLFATNSGDSECSDADSVELKKEVEALQGQLRQSKEDCGDADSVELKKQLETLQDQLRQSEERRKQLELRLAQETDSHKSDATTKLYDIKRNLVRNSEERLAERKYYLSNKWNVEVEAEALRRTTMKDTSAVILAFAQTYPCLWSLDFRVHTHKVADGGKWSSEWVCGLVELRDAVAKWPDRRKCLVYSFGTAGYDDTFFEDRISQITDNGCEMHLFESTMVSPSDGSYKKLVDKCHRKGWNFSAMGLASSDGESQSIPTRTLATVMRERGHLQIDVVKIDCDGCEWDVLSKTDWSKLKIGQLLLTVHDEKSQIPLTELLRYFDQLHKAGFYVFSVEPVRAHSSGQFEIAMLHRNWTPESGFAQEDTLTQLAKRDHTPNVKQPGGR